MGWRPPRAAINYPFLLPARDGLYVGGYAVQTASGLIVLRPDDGRPDPRWRGDVDTSNIEGGSVQMMALLKKRLYFAGMFGKVDGNPVPGLAAVDAVTGKLLPEWRPPLRSRFCTACSTVGGLSAGNRRVFAGIDVLLALSGPGSVRIGLGRRCDYERWTETGRCAGRVTRWLGTVRFQSAGRRHFRQEIPGPHGRYFVRFVPQATGGPLQPPYDDVFRH